MKDSAARSALRSPDAFVAFELAQVDQPIHRRFEAQAALRPDATAVRLATADVTYASLNAAANRAARLLAAAMPAGRKPVALLFDQGYASIVWTLAVLKAGCPYAPLDQRLPEPVLRAMVDDLEPGVLIAGSPYRRLADALAADRIPVLDAESGTVPDARADANLDLPVTGDDIAYVFYTSGSTGTPKGVADCHRNVLHNVLRYTNTLRFAPGDTLSLVQNPSFSGTVSTLFGALTNGAAVAPFDLQGEGLDALSHYLKRARVTMFHGVPSIFRLLSDPIDRFPCIRVVRLEGDRASTADVRHFRANFADACTLVNGLGATECGLVRQFFVGHESPDEDAQPLPIGYPVPDVEARIVDDEGRPLPPGSIGEIVIDSKFLATGYWRNAAMTARRFTALPEGRRRYRTGDLGRMDADGCLTHLGRVDHGIRIGGEFVDPGEIERVLVAVPGIRQCVVRDYVDRAEERRLCAYVVTDAKAGVTVDRLRAVFAEHPAQRAIPTTFVFLDALPLSKDLKVDAKRLPQPGHERPPLPNDLVLPATELEHQLTRIWCEVLEVDSVGVTDSFFDLGGDSLRAAQVATRLRDRHGHSIQVATLFEHMTIRALADALDRSQPAFGSAARDVASGPHPGHSIAVIGMAGRFPGANSIDEFWNNLRSGRESITSFHPDELSAGDPFPGDPSAVAARGVLPDADLFDAALFRLTPRQAAMLDPQQRVWLECVHEALEDAGMPAGARGRSHPGPSIGVFAGARESTYLWHLVGGSRDAVDALLQRSSDEAYQLLLGNDHDSIVTRTSFLMDFVGPSINVQTACSTSLVAIAQACDALANGQCDVAVAGGVAVTFPQKRSYRHAESAIVSNDGHCRPFDASATGTVFSDGVGVVVLKRLDRARADNDRIDAVIRGWAVNNDGANKASFTAPSIDGQTRVIVRAQEHAEVRPDDVTYVEAHGTATPVGDPIEFAALERAFRSTTTARGYCGLGSVKSNIGHLDTAAGVAGLIKTVLALKHREIPPTLHFRTANPEIDVAASPFYIADRLRAWPTVGGQRIAGVTSLGVGGTNCHIVLQEAPAPPSDVGANRTPPFLLTLSAASEVALDSLEDAFRRHLTDGHDADLAAIAATTQRSRSHRAFRSAVLGCDAHEWRDQLANAVSSGQVEMRWRGKANTAEPLRVGFLFAGDGAQYAGMGRALYESNGDFRRSLEHCDRILRGHLDRSLIAAMFGSTGDEALTQEPAYAQPALFALEHALAQLLQSWGIVPACVMGYGIGEYAAACVAGVFSLDDGLILAASRGSLMQRLPGTDAMRTGTGPQARMQAPMDSVLEPLWKLAAGTTMRPPTLRLIGSVDGRAVTSEVTDPTFWRDQARKPVQFAAGVRSLIAEGCTVVVEIGPDAVPAHLVAECDPGERIEMLPTLRRGSDARMALLQSIGRLYVLGADVDWAALQKDAATPPVRVPTYPFQRTRHWYAGPLTFVAREVSERKDRTHAHPLLGRRLRIPGSAELRFENRFSQRAPSFVEDHRLFGVSLPPGASHFAMLAQAARFLGDGATRSQACRFEDLYLLRPLLLPEGCERDVHLAFRPEASGWSIELSSMPTPFDNGDAGDWMTHMIGRVRRSSVDDVSSARPWDLAAAKARCERTISGTDFYTRIWANQGGTGSAFRWIDAAWSGEREALCHAMRPECIADVADYRLHPGLIEAACQTLHCCATIETREAMEASGVTYVPFSVDAFQVFDTIATHDDAWCHAQLRDIDRESVVADLTILTSSGEVVASLDGFCLRPIAREAIGVPEIRRQPRARRNSDIRPVVAGFGADPPKARPGKPEALRYLQSRCAELSGLAPTALDPELDFLDLGLDSIVAAVLSNHILSDFGVRVPIGRILTSPSLGALADDIARGRSD